MHPPSLLQLSIYSLIHLRELGALESNFLVAQLLQGGRADVKSTQDLSASFYTAIPQTTDLCLARPIQVCSNLFLFLPCVDLVANHSDRVFSFIFLAFKSLACLHSLSV